MAHWAVSSPQAKMYLVQDSGMAVGRGEEMEEAAARGRNHVEGSNAGEAHSHRDTLGMLEARKSGVRG